MIPQPLVFGSHISTLGKISYIIGILFFGFLGLPFSLVFILIIFNAESNWFLRALACTFPLSMITISHFFVRDFWRGLRAKTIIDLQSGTVTIKKGPREIRRTIGVPEKFLVYQSYGPSAMSGSGYQNYAFRIDIVGDQGKSPLGFSAYSKDSVIKSAQAVIDTLKLPIETGEPQNALDDSSLSPKNKKILEVFLKFLPYAVIVTSLAVAYSKFQKIF